MKRPLTVAVPLTHCRRLTAQVEDLARSIFQQRARVVAVACKQLGRRGTRRSLQAAEQVAAAAQALERQPVAPLKPF